VSFSVFLRTFAAVVLVVGGCPWCLAGDSHELDAVFAQEPAEPASQAAVPVPFPRPEVPGPTRMDSATNLDVTVSPDPIGTGPMFTSTEPDSPRGERAEKATKSVPVAEPTSFGLLAVGLIFLFFLARSRRAPGRG